jgi:hypothetical protein
MPCLGCNTNPSEGLLRLLNKDGMMSLWQQTEAMHIVLKQCLYSGRNKMGCNAEGVWRGGMQTRYMVSIKSKRPVGHLHLVYEVSRLDEETLSVVATDMQSASLYQCLLQDGGEVQFPAEVGRVHRLTLHTASHYHSSQDAHPLTSS